MLSSVPGRPVIHTMPTPRLLEPLFVDAAIAALFDDRARIQGMLDFEAALARAEAACGLIPEAAVAPIAAACDAGRYDFAMLGQAAGLAGNLAIPLVNMLTAEVEKTDAEAARYVHWGSTSQDPTDTGLIVQLRAGLDRLQQQLDGMIASLAALARDHRHTVMPGRTWLQQAVPITFGLKAAGWLDGLLRVRERIEAMRPRVLVLQFGGAAGSLSALGGDGMRVAAALAAELGLALPDMPWHTQRDRIAEAGAVLGLLTGALGKIARDIALLMQSEVGEAFEPAMQGRGGSSTMPQKRNPVACSVAIAAALRVPGLIATLYAALPQEHERGLGNWPAEWDTLPEIVRLAAGSLAQMAPVLADLDVNGEAMRAHCDADHGLLFAEAASTALAARIGKAAAHACVQAACRRALDENRHLCAVMAEDSRINAHFDEQALAALFSPERCLGANDALIERVLARCHRLSNRAEPTRLS